MIAYFNWINFGLGSWISNIKHKWFITIKWKEIIYKKNE